MKKLIGFAILTVLLNAVLLAAIINGVIDLPVLSSATNPASGFVRLFFKSDGLYTRTAAGVETGPIGGVPWKLYTTAYTADLFKTAATTVTVSLQACTKCVLHGVVLKHSTAFAGTGISAATCKITDGTNDLTASFNVYQATGDTVLYIDGGAQMKTVASAPFTLSCTANTNFGSGSATVLSAGSLDTYLNYAVLP